MLSTSGKARYERKCAHAATATIERKACKIPVNLQKYPHATIGMWPDELFYTEENTNSFFIAVTKPDTKSGEIPAKTESCP